MFSSNSFNVCPHCGKANTLNARYCASCGQPLSVPEEVVVCPRCHKTNSPMASFCGACGTQLKTGQQTKICPRCRKEVDVRESVCSCGYSFSAVQQAEPRHDAKPQKLPKEKHSKRSKDAEPAAYEPAAEGVKVKHKGGRVAAIISLVILLLFVYLVMAPAILYKTDENNLPLLDDNANPIGTKLRPDFLSKLDGGLINDGGDFTYYGWGIVESFINCFKNGSGLNGLKEESGLGILVIGAFLALFIVAVVFHLVVCIFRLVTGKRNKRTSKLFLILAILTTLWAAITIVLGMLANGENGVEGFVAKIAMVFVPSRTFGSGEEAEVLFYNIGWVVAAIPVYFWIATLISAFTKVKVPKGGVA